MVNKKMRPEVSEETFDRILKEMARRKGIVIRYRSFEDLLKKFLDEVETER